MFNNDTKDFNRVFYYKGRRVLSKPKKAWLKKIEKDYSTKTLHCYYTRRYFITEVICGLIMLMCISLKIKEVKFENNLLYDSIAFYADDTLYTNIVNMGDSHTSMYCVISNNEGVSIESKILNPGDTWYTLNCSGLEDYCTLTVTYDLPLRDITEEYTINIMQMY